MLPNDVGDAGEEEPFVDGLFVVGVGGFGFLVVGVVIVFFVAETDFGLLVVDLVVVVDTTGLFIEHLTMIQNNTNMYMGFRLKNYYYFIINNNFSQMQL